MKSEIKVELESIKRQLSILADKQAYLENALMSAEDVEALVNARKDLAEGKTIKLANLKKKLGI